MTSLFSHGFTRVSSRREAGALVSVIVPVYNTEKYIEACIQSVLNQSFQNWELILVDDGSTDRSLEICRRCAEGEERISVLSVAHAGHTHARNEGLARARGEWVCILDADDMLAENALEILLANRENADMVMGLYETLPREATAEAFHEGAYFASYADMGDAFTRFFRPYFFISVCAKLYRRSVMGGGLSEIEKDFSIWLYNLDVLPRCRGIRLVPETVYYYRRVPASVSRHFRMRYLCTCGEIYEKTCETFSAFPEVRSFMARDYGNRVVLYLLGVFDLACLTKPQKLAMIEAEMSEPIYRQEAIRTTDLAGDKSKIWRAFLAQDAETVCQEAERLSKERDEACLRSESPT